jgi:fibronectin-binding autotransporter adhesin
MQRTLLTACITMAMTVGHATAAELFWDVGITGAAGGGSTISEATEWKTSGADNIWWNGTTNVAWANSNDATFGGTAGTVHLGSAISAGTLKFNTAGYTIDLRDFTSGASGNNLTITGLSGSPATIRRSSVGDPSNGPTLTLSMANDTVWGGNIGSGGDRMGVTVSGGKSLTVNQVIRGGGFSQTTLNITGAGTKLILSGAGSTYWGNFVSVNNGATFDLGNNGNFVVRQLSLDATSTVTATGTARIVDDNSNNGSNLAGLVTGTLGIQQSHTGATGMTISNNGNTYSGGTYLTAGTINADANNALGTGVVEISNTTGTATLNFRSAAPIIGSLSSSGGGTKSVVLGNTGVDTTLTVGALNTSTTYGGTISQFTGRVGALTKAGNGTLTLGGASTYTGATTVTGGTLALNATGSIASTILDVQAGTFNASAAASLPTFTSISGAGTINPGSKTVNLTGTLSPNTVQLTRMEKASACR